MNHVLWHAISTAECAVGEGPDAEKPEQWVLISVRSWSAIGELVAALVARHMHASGEPVKTIAEALGSPPTPCTGWWLRTERPCPQAGVCETWVVIGGEAGAESYEIASEALGLLTATYHDDNHFGPVTMEYLSAIGNDTTRCSGSPPA